MPSVNYQALRSIMSGHTKYTLYDLDFTAQTLSEAHPRTITQNTSLGGLVETVFHRADVRWSIVSTPILETGTDWEQWMEFLASVQAGEEFTFDAYGTAASPDNAITVVLIGSATYQRVGASRYVNIAFRVLKQ